MKRRTVTLVVLAAAAGCSTGSAPEATTGEPVETRTVAEATRQAGHDATMVAASLGGPLSGWKTLTVACTNASRLQGAANITVAAADQVAALSRLAAAWRRQGWEITDEQTFADGTRGTVSAYNVTTGTSITVTTTKDLGRVAMVLVGACHLPAPG
ncbi:MAG TPA: hypothetical protein VN408_43515 [Actinoplanes sp.]|nr:hypothetical protein [Actinoplanes sp.]